MSDVAPIAFLLELDRLIRVGSRSSAGPSTRLVNDLDLGSEVRTVYPASTQLVHRFLRPSVCPRTYGTRRRQAHLYVSRGMCWSWVFPLRVEPEISRLIRSTPARACRKHGLVYVCHFCQAHYEQPFGRVVEKVTAKGAQVESFKFISGPPVGEKCPQCDSGMTVSADDRSKCVRRAWEELRRFDFTLDLLVGVRTHVVGAPTRFRVRGRADHDGRGGKGELRDVPEDEGDADYGSRGKSWTSA